MKALSDDLFIDPSFELASFAFGAKNAMSNTDKSNAYYPKYKFGIGEKNGPQANQQGDVDLL
jgi:hypothetical protein